MVEPWDISQQLRHRRRVLPLRRATLCVEMGLLDVRWIPSKINFPRGNFSSFLLASKSSPPYLSTKRSKSESERWRGDVRRKLSKISRIELGNGNFQIAKFSIPIKCSFPRN